MFMNAQPYDRMTCLKAKANQSSMALGFVEYSKKHIDKRIINPPILIYYYKLQNKSK